MNSPCSEEACTEAGRCGCDGAAFGAWKTRVKSPGSREGSAGMGRCGCDGRAGAAGVWNRRVNSPGSVVDGAGCGSGDDAGTGFSAGAACSSTQRAKSRRSGVSYVTTKQTPFSSPARISMMRSCGRMLSRRSRNPLSRENLWRSSVRSELRSRASQVSTAAIRMGSNNSNWPKLGIFVWGENDNPRIAAFDLRVPRWL